MFSRCRLSAILVAIAVAQDCGSPCSDDSDCDSDECSWCSSSTGVTADQKCGGAPDPKDCGLLPGLNTTSKLQYAMWGDSVSKGLFGKMEKLMETDYELFHPATNFGGGTGNVVRGKNCADLWLNGEDGAASARDWDLLTFNFGLHDLAQDEEFVDLDEYQRKLTRVGKQLLKRAKQVYWVSTTPVPDVTLSPPRAQSDVAKYNAAAAQVMEQLGIPIVDLYSFVVAQCGGEHYVSCDGFQKPKNVHFERQGSFAMAQFVYDTIFSKVVV